MSVYALVCISSFSAIRVTQAADCALMSIQSGGKFMILVMTSNNTI